MTDEEYKAYCKGFVERMHKKGYSQFHVDCSLRDYRQLRRSMNQDKNDIKKRNKNFESVWNNK